MDKPKTRVQALARFALRYARHKKQRQAQKQPAPNAIPVAPPTYKPQPLTEVLKVGGAIYVVILGLQLLLCLDGPLPTRACVRSVLWSDLADALHLGALILGVWAGIEVTQRLHRSWLGWLIGIGVTVGLVSFLLWIGVVPPERFADD